MEFINEYTLVHFLLCFGIGRITKLNVIWFLILSIGWEFVETFLPFHLAVESYSNKLMDIIANTVGYFLGRYFRFNFSMKKWKCSN